MRATHTYALLPVSQGVYDEIRQALEVAGYDHALLTNGAVVLDEIAIIASPSPIQPPQLKSPEVLEEIITNAHELLRTTPPVQPNPDDPTDKFMADFMARDCLALKRAGCELAAAALHVATHYDGVHRLMLATAAWAQALADEGGRAERYAGTPNAVHSSTDI